MFLFRLFSLRTLFIFATFSMLFSFFALLIVTNIMNRRGIHELQRYDVAIASYSARLRDIECDIATYSSLSRIESRAQEMGYSPTRKIEYLR